MLKISGAAELPAEYVELAVAIGKFDGVHLGHAALIHELVEYASDAAITPAVVTFDRHPNQILNPDRVPKPICSLDTRARLLEEFGVEVLLTLPFDSDLAALSPEEFVSKVLTPIRAKMVFVGEGFRFGAGGKGDISTLRQLGSAFGFRVREVSHVELAGVKVSSTLVRQQLDEGRVEIANALLGRNHQVVGVIEHGRKLGRTLGFPTANFSRESDGYLPVDGVYAGWLIADGVRYKAAHSIGTNDSIAEVPRLLESHVIGRDDLDLYGKLCVAEFEKLLRPWSKFSSLEELISQIAKDVSRSEEILSIIKP